MRMVLSALGDEDEDEEAEGERRELWDFMLHSCGIALRS